eukprot:TRINITY_DN42125_c0_g1_i1.p1 TRINITY_DN42125_c0_g1~~TRINITY_DN42125_c0_g1_i1.p1  ORF type:complete len:284 (+),score=48.90 TRINITY_DN42125_c0_g1_i1:21-872(+)
MSKKAEQRLEQKIKDGEFYEALQLYKSLFGRKVARHPQSAFDLLQNGIPLLAEAGQHRGASELAILISKSMATWDLDAVVEHYSIILSAMANNVEKLEAAEHAVNFAVKLEAERAAAVKAAPSNRGPPELRLCAARVAISLQDFGKAMDHLYYSDDPEMISSTLLNWIAHGNRSEADLFLVRTVLRLLVEGDLCNANIVNGTVTKSLGLDTPLIHFSNYIILVCQRDSAALFTTIVKEYGVALSRDPSFMPMLNSIGKKYFRIQPAPANPMAAMLQNMMGGGM